MPSSSPYLPLAYGVFVVLLAIYVGIIVFRMRRTARERRNIEAQLAEREGVHESTVPEQERVVA